MVANSAGRRAWFLCGLGGVLLLFVSLRWNTFDYPLVRDEGEYAYAAQLLRHGLAPYEHSFLQKPPMIVYSYALAAAIAPKVFWFPRVVAYLFATGATALLGYIAGVEFGKRFVLPVVFLTTPMILLPGPDQNTANTEMFMILPLLGTVAVYVKCRTLQTGDVKWAWFGAGVLAALTFWYKYTSAPLLAVVFGAWSLEAWRHGSQDRRALVEKWVYALLGVIAASAAAVGWLVLRDGGWHLWECTILFNRYYAASSSFSTSGLWVWLGKFWRAWWILFLLPLVLLLRPKRPLGFWLLMFLAAWVSTGMSNYGQYYIVVMPFWALLAGVAIVHIAETAFPAATSKSMAWAASMTGAVVILICWPDFQTLFKSRAKLTAEIPDILLNSIDMSDRISHLTSPADYVFVAGSEPQILSCASRLSPTRFVIAYPLMIPTPVAKTYQTEAIRDLEAHPPALIVFVPAGSSWLKDKNTPPEFFQFLDWTLAKHYELAGGYVPDAQSGHWESADSKRELGSYTLALFKRTREH